MEVEGGSFTPQLERSVTHSYQTWPQSYLRNEMNNMPILLTG